VRSGLGESRLLPGSRPMLPTSGRDGSWPTGAGLPASPVMPPMPVHPALLDEKSGIGVSFCAAADDKRGDARGTCAKCYSLQGEFGHKDSLLVISLMSSPARHPFMKDSARAMPQRRNSIRFDFRCQNRSTGEASFGVSHHRRSMEHRQQITRFGSGSLHGSALNVGSSDQDRFLPILAVARRRLLYRTVSVSATVLIGSNLAVPGGRRECPVLPTFARRLLPFFGETILIVPGCLCCMGGGGKNRVKRLTLSALFCIAVAVGVTRFMPKKTIGHDAMAVTI